MSEVKKISPVGNIYGWEESQFGEFVLRQDYDDLAAEAQALREEVAALRAKLAMAEDAAAKGYAARQQCGGMEMEIQELRAELAALRARVVVVPDASTVYVALDTLRRFATGEVGHLNNGHCPDDLEGRSARDPNCSVCRALIDTEKSK
ncbi:hypothetical protein ACSEQ4_20555 [Pseudomonas aeruginosa]